MKCIKYVLKFLKFKFINNFENYLKLTCKYSEENLAAARNDIDPIISEYSKF